MKTSHFILATAGHVDHGKSSLIKALTGTDPDRLPEEKSRKMTIELGFAHLVLPSSKDIEKQYHLGIIDVPGHEDFVKTMVAGVGSIDLALLVIDSTEGWMPQTEEHIQILDYLKVRHGLVAMTKVDLVDRDALNLVKEQAREKLKGTFLADPIIVFTSTLTGQGHDELPKVLAEILDLLSLQADIGKPRLHVDRAFSRPGFGTVVTGTLTGGFFQVGKTVAIQPGDQTTRIRGIQTFSDQVHYIGPGTRAALNLRDMEIRGPTNAGGGNNSIQRGNVVTLPGIGKSSDTMDILFERSPRLAKGPLGSRRQVKHTDRVRIHLGSRSTPARIFLLGKKEIGLGDRVLAQLRFEESIFAFVGDAFVVRDWPGQFTLGGGVVLDPVALRRGYRGIARKSFLSKRSESPYQVHGYLESILDFERETPEENILCQSRFSKEEVAEALAVLLDTGQALRVGKFIVQVEFFESLKEELIKAVNNEHDKHPERIGIMLSAVKNTNFANSPSPQILDSAINVLCKEGFNREGAYLKRANHCIDLPKNMAIAAEKIRNNFKQNPFEPLSRKELAVDPIQDKALHFLIESGEMVALGKEIILAKDAYIEMVDRIKRCINEKGAATVSELKQAVGTSRRIMIPLLEFLDRKRITFRKGNHRTLE